MIKGLSEKAWKKIEAKERLCRDIMDGLVAGFVLAVLCAFLILVVGMIGCDTGNYTDAGVRHQQRTHSERVGTIICFQPWNNRLNGGAHPSVAYSGRVENWTADMHTTHHQQIRTHDGVVTTTSTTVQFTDTDGNEVYLLNYPCRIIVPRN